MKCKNFTCIHEAAQNWPCCDNSYGYAYKQDRAQMQKYVDGLINWRWLKNGLTTYWTVEQCEYYLKQIYG